MADVKTYNPRNIILIAIGIPIKGGFAPGSKIKVTQVNPSFSVQEGVDGDITRSASNSTFTRITFRLLQTSKWNAALSAAHAADRASDNGQPSPSTVTDKGGASETFLRSSWIVAMPEADYSGEDTFREWVIEGSADVNYQGGN